MRVVHFNVRRGSKEKRKRKVMGKAVRSMSPKIAVCPRLWIYTHMQTHTCGNTLTLSVLSNSVSPRSHGIFSSFIQHSSSYSSVVLLLSLLLAAVSLLFCAPSSLIISVKNSRNIFKNQLSCSTEKKLHFEWTTLLMYSYIYYEMESVSHIMQCALDMNSAVGLCYRCFFFPWPFDATGPDKTRHSQLKPLVCCHTYSQSLFMECDHQLQRLWESESAHKHGCTVSKIEICRYPGEIYHNIKLIHSMFDKLTNIAAQYVYVCYKIAKIKLGFHCLQLSCLLSWLLCLVCILPFCSFFWFPSFLPDVSHVSS